MFILNGVLDITSRKTKLGLNVLFSFTYIFIVIFVLTVITFSVTTYLGKYFLSVREEEQSAELENCALELTPYMEDASPDSIYSILSAYAIKCNGRILFVDNNGCVQSDTFCLLNGTVPEVPEVKKIIAEKQSSATGYRKIQLNESSYTADNKYLGKATTSFWSGYYSKAVMYGGEQKGALLLVSPVQDIVERVFSVVKWLVIFCVVFILGVGAVTFYLSNILTLSIRRFNRAIGKMASGDFSARVDENEIAEFGELARAFNMMSSQIENLDSSRNQFVSDASHELKTPLASMKILSESLLSQPDAPPELYREFLGDINNEVDRLSLVINDLLTLVKTDKGMETLVFGPVALGTVIKRIIGTVAPLAKSKHITVSFEYSDVTVQADELRIQQLFTNLIDNAIKYSPENTTITVMLVQTLSSAVVTVSDQGIGIPTENLNRVFERFYRVDKARSRKAGGTGLGLSIVKQIVEMHGGTIDVTSEVNVGTTFTVVLPLQQKELRKDNGK